MHSCFDINITKLVKVLKTSRKFACPLNVHNFWKNYPKMKFKWPLVTESDLYSPTPINAYKVTWLAQLYNFTSYYIIVDCKCIILCFNKQNPVPIGTHLHVLHFSCFEATAIASSISGSPQSESVSQLHPGKQKKLHITISHIFMINSIICATYDFFKHLTWPEALTVDTNFLTITIVIMVTVTVCKLCKMLFVG